MNDLYTQVVEFEIEDSNSVYGGSFFVDKCHLIFKFEYSTESYSEITYYDLGEFVDTLRREEACNHIKSYAQYVINGFAENGYNLIHCPFFERIDGVDDKFNPIGAGDWLWKKQCNCV